MQNSQIMGKKFGPYDVIKLIGTGGQSAVFAARHHQTNQVVALRVMAMTVADLKAATEECNEVLDEIASIDAPNIVRIEDYGTDGNMIYIAMSIMNGGSLAERMKARMEPEVVDDSQLPSAIDLLNMVSEIADALDDIHSRGIVHGQVGPRTILFDEMGKAYLSDIGITRLMKIIFKLDATNSFSMNAYSAPELWNGERPSPATDQYALACVVYELLTGKAPFNNTSIFHLMNAHMNDVAAPPHYIRKDLPGDLAMVFWQALAKPIDNRFPSMWEFYEGLKEAFGVDTGEATDFFTFKLESK